MISSIWVLHDLEYNIKCDFYVYSCSVFIRENVFDNSFNIISVEFLIIIVSTKMFCWFYKYSNKYYYNFYIFRYFN